jgi:hypothetical protein
MYKPEQWNNITESYAYHVILFFRAIYKCGTDKRWTTCQFCSNLLKPLSRALHLQQNSLKMKGDPEFNIRFVFLVEKNMFVQPY